MDRRSTIANAVALGAPHSMSPAELAMMNGDMTVPAGRQSSFMGRRHSSRSIRQYNVTDNHHSVREGKESCFWKLFNCLRGSSNYRNKKLLASHEGVNSASAVDRLARIFFPLSFFIFNVLYWMAYLDGAALWTVCKSVGY